MNPDRPAVIAGLILAGGRARRLGGRHKALLPLAGKPMLQHVFDRLQPQVARVVLSVDQARDALSPFGLEQLPDPVPGHRGPLGGLLSGLRWLQHHGHCQWLLMVPCDAPFLPLRLAAELSICARRAATAGAVVVEQGEIQPTFSLWHVDLLPELEKAVTVEAMSGFKQFLDNCPLATLEWQSLPSDGELPAFFNINDNESLQQAQLLLQCAEGLNKHAQCQ